VRQPRLLRGRAWYAGRQERDNSIYDQPEEPYLCEPPNVIVDRSWYSGAMGLRRVGERELQVDYFVDPVRRHVFIQLVAGADATPAAPAARPFAEARELARQVRRQWELDRLRAARKSGTASPPEVQVSAHTAEERERVLRAWWSSWVAWDDDTLPPIPLDVPAEPASAYAVSGWAGWEDWLLKPREDRQSAA
jgi:hypothetical protein